MSPMAKWFLAAAFAVFLVTFVAILAFVRGRGYDPKGVASGSAKAAIVITVGTVLWLAVLLLYIFDARSVAWFGHISFLDSTIAEELGFALLRNTPLALLTALLNLVPVDEDRELVEPSSEPGDGIALRAMARNFKGFL